MITEIFIGTQKIDLFKDETIDLNSSVANTDDITKVNTDYTKSFTVPASERNNFIFKHYYNADIDNTFDARVKVQGEIKIDGFPFKSGKFRLEKVAVKNGLAQSYTINFWGNLINIKELLGEKKLSDLDFSFYDHNEFAFELGLQSTIENNSIIYTLDNSQRQYIYNSNPLDNTNTEKLVNIANNNATNKGIIYKELKPSIRLTEVLKVINDTFNLRFSDDFFSREELIEIFLWLNNTTGTAQYKDFNLIDFTETDSDKFNIDAGILNFQTFVNSDIDKQRLVYFYQVELITDFDVNYNYFLVVRDNDVIISKTSLTNNSVGTVTVESTDFVNHNYTFGIEVIPTNGFAGFPAFNFYLSFQYQNFDGSAWVNDTLEFANALNDALTFDIDVSKNMPDIKVIDFLSGIFKMFKLVAIGNDDGSIYVNTLDSYYKEGKLRDFTKYFDVKNYDVERGVIAKEINFNFEESSTILNLQYKKNNNIAYGDSVLRLVDENNTPLDGDKIDVKLPFETILYERLPDLNTNAKTNIQYGLSVNETLDSVVTKPVLFYRNIVNISDTPIKFFNSSIVLNGNLNVASSTLGLNTATNSLLWNNEFSTWNGALINNTLYSNYWQNYIESIFNIKKRIFKYKAKLPIYLLTQLKLNDIIKIKDSYFKINDYNVNLLTGESSFNLINNFDTNFNLFAPSKKEFYQDYTSQTFKIYVSNSSVMNITLQDLGFGTDFITAVKNGNYIDVTLTQNSLTQNRDVFINVNNGSGKTFQIYINQDNEI
jgi:hypothetical protein